MVVGVATIIVHLPAVGSLKGKRSVLNSVKGRVRSRFNASIAEVEDMDLWQKAVLGVAVVSNDKRHASGALERIRALIESESRLDILDYSIRME